MPRDKQGDSDRIAHIINECIFLIAIGDERSLKDFESNGTILRAACFSLAIIGEASHHLSPEFKETNSLIQWHQIYALRNALVHGYDSIVTELIWQTIIDDIPILRNQLIAFTKI